MVEREVALFDQGVEDRFFRAVISYDRLLSVCVGIVDESNFSTRAKAKLWEAISFYWREFGELPSRDLLEITIQEMYAGEQVSLVLRLLRKIYELPVPEWRWIVKKLDEYIKTIHLQKAIYEASGLLKKGDVMSAEDKIIEAVRSSGVLFGGVKNDLDLGRGEIYDLAQGEGEFCCPTRIYALDDLLRGLYRKELFLVMAPMNVGKSWAMVHFAVSALLSGKYVLYLTLEMSRDRVLRRILQNVSGTYVPKFADDLEKEIELWDESWQIKEEAVGRSLLDLDRVVKNVGILKRFGGMLSVKEFASGEAKVSDIERMVGIFDVEFGKVPDVLLVDGLMDIDYSGSTDMRRQRLGLARVARELRRIASDSNCCAVTTHQANREGLAASVVGAQHTGESIGIVQVADTGISLNQSKAEHQLGKMRISVMRARNQKKWGMCEIYQNLDIGQFCQASQLVEDVNDDEKKGGPRRRKVRGRDDEA